MTLPPPQLRWSEDGAPIDAQTGDVFFSRAGGLAEAEAVFLAGCGLPERWAGRSSFAIAELGFGSGLNALAAWRRWRETRPAGAVLHLVSVEQRPWRVAEAARAHALFPELARESAALCARWPIGAAGPQRLWFAEDGFCLTLLFGEAQAMLEGLEARFDAWFLDGFAPSKNPQMWTPALLAQVRRLSAPNARLATYSVARSVRDALQSAGFGWSKHPGFGAKRERLEAWPESGAAAPAVLPWTPYGPAGAGPVAVIGAGVGGANVAAALRRRGRDVVVLEAANNLGAGASGNPAALVAPRLDFGETPAARFYRAAYLAALDAIAQSPAFTACGVRQACAPERALRFAAEPPLPLELLVCGPDWLHHPRAGVVQPLRLLEELLAGCPVRFGVRAAQLQPVSQGWRVLDGAGAPLAEAAAVVLAAGPGVCALAGLDWLALQGSRGQIEHAERCTAPPEARSDGAYAAPIGAGLVFGATFDPVALDAAVAPDAHSRAWNLAALERLAPEIRASLQPQALRSRTAVRAAAADRLPIVGLAPDAHAPRGPSLPGRAGLYLLGALGARGFTTAPLLAERLAAEITGEPQPLDRQLLRALHPARFLERRLRRGQS